MFSRLPPLNPNFLAMARGVRELHQLSAIGREDSPEEDAIRDATDAAWGALSEIERDRIRYLSEDLFSLTETPGPVQPTNPQAQAKLNDAFEARKQGDWDRALALLRRWQAYLDPALLSHLRGTIWMDLGDAATAALFFKHAADLEPKNGNYQAMSLVSQFRADPAEAGRRSDEILREPQRFAPAVVAHASEIALRSVRSASETEAANLFRRLIPILQATLRRFEEEEAGVLDRSAYVMAVGQLGAAHEFLGETRAALEAYTRGLHADPANDVLLVARGVLTYGASAGAVADLELAARYGSSLIWPYFFLAHDHLVNGRYQECRLLCERALTLPGSAAVKSELSEWLAIAQSELGFPADLIHAAFEAAIRTDPSNERARRNAAAFEAALRPPTRNNWETRTTAAVRTASLSERRYSMAA